MEVSSQGKKEYTVSERIPISPFFGGHIACKFLTFFRRGHTGKGTCAPQAWGMATLLICPAFPGQLKAGRCSERGCLGFPRVTQLRPVAFASLSSWRCALLCTGGRFLLDTVFTTRRRSTHTLCSTTASALRGQPHTCSVRVDTKAVIGFFFCGGRLDWDLGLGCRDCAARFWL